MGTGLEPRVPKPLPFEPATYRSEKQMLLQAMSQCGSVPTDTSVVCDLPSSRVDPDFYRTITTQAKLDPLSRRGRLHTVSYEEARPFEANLKWVTAYKQCVDEVNPYCFFIHTASKAYEFRACEAFWKTLLPRVIEASGPALKVRIEHVCDGAVVDDASFEMSVGAWNAVVDDWNKQLPFQKDDADRVNLQSSEAGSETMGSVCSCTHHSPERAHASLGSVMASVFQEQRRLHFALMRRDAFTAEQTVARLDALNAFGKVVELLAHCFPDVAHEELTVNYPRYVQLILDNPLGRAKPGGKRPLPATWPPAAPSF